MPDPRLQAVLVDLRRRIERASSRGLNEQNTKATLIEPLLRALGWDPEDVEEVAREYRLKSRDKPVDYGLLVLREPRLFVEAKGLGENLDDRRWANQIMGYAVVAGVEWILLTNGDEYRIYNTHAAVQVEEKLFRTVRITDPSPIVAETLGLLAKGQLGENRLDLLWRAHFIDKKVKAALNSLFAGDNDLALVNFVLSRTKDLRAEDVRASIRRCKLHLDFPIATEQILAEEKARSNKAGRATSKAPKTPAFLNVSLKQLIDARLVRPPVALVKDYKGQKLSARIETDGSVTWNGKSFDSLSGAGSAARASVIGPRADGSGPQTGGWSFWKCAGPGGELVEVDQIRREFLREQETKTIRRASGQRQ